MKILYVFRSLAVWGGIERIFVDKMNHLVTMYGYDVYMLTADQGQHPVPYHLEPAVHLEDLGIRFHQQYRYGGLRRLQVAWRLKRQFEQRLAARLASIVPDVIVCTTTDYVDTLVRLKGAIPLVVESHSICSRTFGQRRHLSWYLDWRLKRSLAKAQVIVALTEGDAADWRHLCPNVAVIPNMVHLNPTGKYSDNASKRVIFVGRFDYQKRVASLVDIWQQVHPQFPDWHLDIYGEGELRQEIDRSIGTDVSITIHRPTAQIFDRYCESAFLVSTSLFEPFGLVIPEAMSCGLPVVAYDCPYGPASIITDRIDGFLVRLDDEDAFAQRMCQLMANEPLRRQMGQAAIASAQRFSADRIMLQWKRLFEQLTCRHNA